MQIKRHLRNFGVLEIILSTAILAAFSVFAIQLFIKASDNQANVVLLDKSTYTAVSIAEQFKAGETPFALSGKYGGKADKDSYTRTVTVSPEIRAKIVVSRDDEMTDEKNAGGMYSVNITMVKSKDGTELYHLTALKYFTKTE